MRKCEKRYTKLPDCEEKIISKMPQDKKQYNPKIENAKLPQIIMPDYENAGMP